MPIYEYECAEHGVFEEHRSVTRAAEDGLCPVCQLETPRIVSAVNLGRIPRSQVKAMERNEKSRHEPRVVDAAARPAGPLGAMKSPGHGYPWAIGH